MHRIIFLLLLLCFATSIFAELSPREKRRAKRTKVVKLKDPNQQHSLKWKYNYVHSTLHKHFTVYEPDSNSLQILDSLTSKPMKKVTLLDMYNLYEEVLNGRFQLLKGIGNYFSIDEISEDGQKEIEESVQKK